MKTIWLIIILSLISKSISSKSEIINGDLYFKKVDLFQYYENGKDNREKYFIGIINDLSNKRDRSESEEKLLKFLINLKGEQLLNAPNIRIKDGDEIKLIFMEHSHYEKIRQYDLNTLLNENKKINLSIEIQELHSGIIVCKKILKVNKIKGPTPWGK